MNYKGELRKKIKKTGRTLIWISSQLEMPRQTFWRKCNSDSFTKEEKNKISKLLSI
jgi:hypothetical protein